MDQLRTTPTVPPSDTDASASTAYLEMLRGIPGPERLRRALELTVLARDLSWAGAVRREHRHGRAAIIRRFMRQFHGDEVAKAFESALDLSSA